MHKTKPVSPAKPLVLTRETLANLQGAGSMAEYLTVLATVAMENVRRQTIGVPRHGGVRRG